MQPLVDVSASHTLPYSRPYPEPPRQEGISFVTIRAALRRHKAIIFATVVVVSLLVIGVLMLVPAHYTAVASLAIEPAETRELVGKPVAPGLPSWMPNDNSVMITQVNLLRTRTLASRVVDQLKLADDPEFRSLSGSLKAWLVEKVQHWFPSAWHILIPWEIGSNLQAKDEDAAIRYLLSALSVQQQETSHIITVSFTSVDPKKAAQIANAIVSAYLQNQIDAKSQSINRASQWAAARVREERLALTKSEIDAADFIAKHRLMATNGLPEPDQASSERTAHGGLTGQQLIKLQDALDGALTQLAAQQAKLSEIERRQARHLGYGSLSEVLNSPVILELQKNDAALRMQEAELAASYASSPMLAKIRAQRAAISQRLAEETQNTVQSVRDDVSVSRERVQRLEAMLSNARQQYTDTERDSVELRELNRTASAHRSLYEKMLAYFNEISGQKGLIEPDAEVISSAAVPSQPSFPNKVMFAGIGFLGSLVLGVVLAALAEHTDKTLRTGQQIEHALGLTYLGLVPRLDNRKRRREPLSTLFGHPDSPYTEAMRSILVQLLRDRGRSGTQVVLVTSAVPGEGKTVVALSLAAVAARLGRRAAVVDLDLRHPSLALTAGLTVKAGLAEFMCGEVEFNDIVQNDPAAGRLNYIPLSGPEFSSADVLSGWNIDKLNEILRGRYDCVFLDVPPSLAISDIQAVSGLADTTLFVVQWGKTSCSAALNGIAALIRIGLPVHGVALTQVDLKQYALYGYEQFGEYHQRYLAYFRG